MLIFEGPLSDLDLIHPKSENKKIPLVEEGKKGSARTECLGSHGH